MSNVEIRVLVEDQEPIDIDYDCIILKSGSNIKILPDPQGTTEIFTTIPRGWSIKSQGCGGIINLDFKESCNSKEVNLSELWISIPGTDRFLYQPPDYNPEKMKSNPLYPFYGKLKCKDCGLIMEYPVTGSFEANNMPEQQKRRLMEFHATQCRGQED